MTVFTRRSTLLTRTANESALPLELVGHSGAHDAWFAWRYSAHESASDIGIIEIGSRVLNREAAWRVTNEACPRAICA